MKSTLLITLLLTQCLLSACSLLDRHAMDVDLTVQHAALTKHFEDEANEIQVKVEEHKKLLSHYESDRYVYGRHATDLKAHSQDMIRIYEHAVVANRELVRKLRENGY